ncbi:hypothetical protein [Luteibacter sahnii]|uniref:hypothetical protein n=1 Tax=Luteibacter sahnii TaxID=3021977 RepID=UPI002A69C680|nr:hypothetical protein [Luteibacter sp. PPL193]MDY1548035.1 hypothetical protein [Luteibacter sp. PPL193]
MFQAKRVEPPQPQNGNQKRTRRSALTFAGRVLFEQGEARLDVHRRPHARRQPKALWRSAQMLQLSRTGRDILRVQSLAQLPGESELGLAEVFARYRANGPTVPGDVSVSFDATVQQLAEGVGYLTGKLWGSEARKARDKFQARVAEWLGRTKDARRMIVGLENRAILERRWVAPTFADLSWIHYVAYLRDPPTSQHRDQADGAVTVPLSELVTPHATESKSSAKSPNIIDLATVQCRSFANLLLAGVSDSRATGRGWLDVDRALVEAIMPALRSHGKVVNLRTQRGWRLELKRRERLADLRLLAAARPRDERGRFLPGFGPPSGQAGRTDAFSATVSGALLGARASEQRLLEHSPELESEGPPLQPEELPERRPKAPEQLGAEFVVPEEIDFTVFTVFEPTPPAGPAVTQRRRRDRHGRPRLLPPPGPDNRGGSD